MEEISEINLILDDIYKTLKKKYGKFYPRKASILGADLSTNVGITMRTDKFAPVVRVNFNSEELSITAIFGGVDRKSYELNDPSCFKKLYDDIEYEVSQID